MIGIENQPLFTNEESNHNKRFVIEFIAIELLKG